MAGCSLPSGESRSIPPDVLGGIQQRTGREEEGQSPGSRPAGAAAGEEAGGGGAALRG